MQGHAEPFIQYDILTCVVSEHPNVCLHNVANSWCNKGKHYDRQLRCLQLLSEPAHLLSKHCLHFYDPTSSVLIPSHIGESSPGVPPCPARLVPWGGLQQGTRYSHDLAAHGLQACPQRLQTVCCERLAS